jgi:hypothetical protein
MRRAGVETAIPASLEVEIVEDIIAAESDAADGEFCFADDLRAPTGTELADAITLLAFSRADMLSAAAAVPDTVLDWRPPPSAMARIDPWNPQPYTIREIMQTIAASEFYYRTGLVDGPVQDDPPDELRDLDVQRVRLIASITALAEADRARVFRPQRPWQASAEHWTLRKVIRRALRHERFHTAEVRQRLAWLQLGVPDFGRSASS